MLWAEPVVRILGGVVLILTSWSMILQMLRYVRGVPMSVRIGKEVSSVAFDVAAYAILFVPVTLRGRDMLTTTHKKFLWTCFAAACTAIITVHLLVHLTVPNHHRQTQELMIMLARVTSDVIMFFCGCNVVLSTKCSFSGCRWFLDRRKKNQYPTYGGALRLRVRYVVLVGIILFMLLASTLPGHFQGGAKRLLEVGMLGDYVDFCGFEGKRLMSSAANGWVIPEYTHRRLLNAYSGSDQCGVNKISFMDEDEAVLVVLPFCPDGGEKPAIYRERPERSELNNGPEVLPKVQNNSLAWHRIMEARYGTDEETHKSMGVRVNRDHSGLIQSVEVLPSALNLVRRKPRTKQERVIRANWPTQDVWQIPLGDSGAYGVYCPFTDYEEYHMFPPPRKRSKTDMSANTTGNAQPQPPASVLVLVLDAVSRQEVLRSLPKFSKWLQKIRDDDMKPHIFVEAKGATTLSHSTEANFVPLLTGRVPHLMKEHEKSGSLHKSLFHLVKERYGDRFSTSYTIGDCFDLMTSILKEKNYSAGFGEPYADDVDYHTFGPFCHLQYSALEGNFQGGNSILKRCIGQQYVHEYVLNYTRALLKRRLSFRRRQRQAKDFSESNLFPILDDADFFFDVSHLVEGHEGTHGVLYLVDGALTAFLEELRTELHFFDDPSNILVVLSDHGNHMGPYYELTAPGKLERALPFAGMILHPDVLSRVDRLKGQEVGSAQRNLKKRTSRISTHLDIYLTLADLLGVEGKLDEDVLRARVPPLSFFEMRDNPPVDQCEDILALNNKASGCYLEWCESL
ncbi:hypothetical protein DQ04_05841020 [Trypanosoma grayi]|uniref:hypothetical protein n=1 Tax=Trypanosoma grayi TaxID=71804 RepID=UPI0004F4A74B|nr:hypothetical protein DQ04_05841020 [Trypanosoma grayi]KEG09091.1 hypothetical protein DQ04_05841020 [Trypanosoma grayi]